MKPSDFAKMLYNRFAPKKPFTEKEVYVPQTKPHSPGLPLSSYQRSVDHVFNNYCTEMGVQVMTTMDPSDFKQMVCFKVVGNRDVRIDYKGTVHILGPGEHTVIKIERDAWEYGEFRLPQLTLLPHGNFHDANSITDLNKHAGVNREFFQYATLQSMLQKGRQ